MFQLLAIVLMRLLGRVDSRQAASNEDSSTQPGGETKTEQNSKFDDDDEGRQCKKTRTDKAAELRLDTRLVVLRSYSLQSDLGREGGPVVSRFPLAQLAKSVNRRIRLARDHLGKTGRAPATLATTTSQLNCTSTGKYNLHGSKHCDHHQ